MNRDEITATPETTLNTLRSRGWMVAAHNDYRQSGGTYTFYLLTHGSGRWVKGEGRTDEDALDECVKQIDRFSLEKPIGYYASRLTENRGSKGCIELGFDTYEQASKFLRWIERLMENRQ